MGRIYAIALNAYREAIRDRVLLAMLGMSLASLLFGTAIAWLSIAEQVRILVDHGMVTLSWLSNLVAVFLGASFLHKEIELRTLYAILSKPVARWQFVVGKYVGILTTTVVFAMLTASALLLLLAMQVAESHGTAGAGVGWLSHQMSAHRAVRLLLVVLVIAIAIANRAVGRRVRWLVELRASLGVAVSVLAALAALVVCALLSRAVAPAETRYVLLGLGLVMGEVVIIAAVAVLFSSFSTPVVTGLLTFGVFLVGRSAGAMLELRGRQLPFEVRELLRRVATVVPNLQLYVPSRDALGASDDAISTSFYLAQVSGYAALYASVLLVLAVVSFRRRDLQ